MTRRANDPILRRMSNRPHPDGAEPKGLPGGIALPAVLFLLSMAAFVVFFSNPELVDLGPNLSPGGLGVLGSAVTFLWLLVAIAKRPPPG
ncbi:MAG: hypothetical protein SangKO_070500 [Sandaracinaceae bacterium]